MTNSNNLVKHTCVRCSEDCHAIRKVTEEENGRFRHMLEKVLAGLENGNIKSQPLMRPITQDATSVGMCSLAELIRETLTPNAQADAPPSGGRGRAQS